VLHFSALHQANHKLEGLKSIDLNRSGGIKTSTLNLETNQNIDETQRDNLLFSLEFCESSSCW
jgi:hypothetical protein